MQRRTIATNRMHVAVDVVFVVVAYVYILIRNETVERKIQRIFLLLSMRAVCVYNYGRVRSASISYYLRMLEVCTACDGPEAFTYRLLNGRTRTATLMEAIPLILWKQRWSRECWRIFWFTDSLVPISFSYSRLCLWKCIRFAAGVIVCLRHCVIRRPLVIWAADDGWWWYTIRHKAMSEKTQ